ncbi:MAG: DUF1049 domain-containing protein [Candidatus Rokuibacteriota bacterium]|nr:MAG: DUF1049 domain-containing protein [Candidatus Rokubacteria bacterium]
MQLLFFATTILLVAVAVFALQNPGVVTIQFLAWQASSSLAVVTLAAAASGAFIATLLGLTARLRRWRRDRSTGQPNAKPAAPPPAANAAAPDPMDRP